MLALASSRGWAVLHAAAQRDPDRSGSSRSSSPARRSSASLQCSASSSCSSGGWHIASALWLRRETTSWWLQALVGVIELGIRGSGRGIVERQRCAARRVHGGDGAAARRHADPVRLPSPRAWRGSQRGIAGGDAEYAASRTVLSDSSTPPAERRASALVYHGVSVRALIGTRKGLFVLHGDDARREWHLAGGPLLEGLGRLSCHGRRAERHSSTRRPTTSSTAPPSSVRLIVGRRGSGRSRSRLPEGSDQLFTNAWACRAGPAGGAGDSLPRGRSRRPLPLRRRRRDLGCGTGAAQHLTRDRWLAGAGGSCCHSIQLDPNDSRADVRRHHRGWDLPHGRRR